MKRILQNTLRILNNKERRQFYILILLNVVISIIDITSLALLVLLISFYTGNARLGFIIKTGWLSDRNSILPIVLFVILFILKSIFGYLIFIAQYSYVYKVASRISRDNLLKYLRGSYQHYVQIDSSIQVRKILHQPIEFCHYVLTGIQQVIAESVLSLFTIIVILIFNANLFLLLIAVLVPPVIIVAWYTKKKLKQARANVKISNEKTLQHLQEALSGYIESNINDKHLFFTDRYSNYQQKMSQYLADVHTTHGIPSRLIEVFAVLGLFILIVLNKVLGNTSAVEIINIGAFMAAAYKIIPGIVKISNISGQIKTYEYTINDLLQNDDIDLKEKGQSARTFQSVKFTGVSFKHHDNIILHNFDLNVAAGDIVGISGASGRGKTTFINLLLGFLSPAKGNILFNNTIVSPTDIQPYWKSIAYVQQRPFLINDTIAANITLSDVNDEAHLQEIIHIVGLEEFISQQQDGLNKVITENGKNISGGQRQRIALARALYKNADLIILDEPMSELDMHSEHVILEHLKKLCANGKMIILVTHNKENLYYCNKTFFID